MAHPSEKKTEARAAYIGGLDLESAATKAGIPYATARRWKADARAEGDDWDKFRRVSLIVAGGEIEQAMGRVLAATLLRAEATLEHLNNTEELDPLEATRAVASLMDSINKGHAVGQRLMPQSDKLGIAMDVIQRMTEYAAKKKPALATELIELLEPFGEELARVYG
jgi:hypothetical protein